MTDYRTQNSGELPEQRSVLLAELSRLERESQAADSDIQRAHQNRMMFEASLSSAQDTLDMLRRMANQQAQEAMSGETGAGPGVDPSVLDLRRAEEELAQIETRYSENHPDVVRGRQTVARLRRIVEENKAAAAAAVPQQDAQSAADSGSTSLTLLAGGGFAQSIVRERERIDNLRAQIELAAQQIKAAEARRAQIAARMGMIDSRLGRMPMHEQELAKVNRDYEISMENYRSLLEKRIEAELASEMETRQKAEKFSVLDPARLPEKPVRPDRVLLLAITVGAGLLASCLIGFGVELKTNVLLGEWELPPHVALLGQVPFIQFDAETGEATTRRRWRVPRFAWIGLSVMLVAAAGGGALLYYLGWLSL
jgi:uncharacterized protein involved in exopolysaccharide biosynthesis